MSDRHKAFLSVFIGTFIGGAVAAVTKIGLIQIPPLSFAFLRFFLAFLVLLPFFVKKKDLIRNVLLLSPVTLLATVNIMLFVTGLKTTTATIGQLIYAASPILIALIMHFAIKDKLRLRQIIGVASGFLGVSIVVLLPIIEKGEFSGDIKGNMLIAIGAILWSFYLLLSKKLQKMQSPMFITFVFIFVTTVILFPFFAIDLYRNQNWISQLNIQSIASIIYVAIAATIFTYLLNQYAIKHGGVIFASMNSYLAPIFAFLWANILLGEQLTVFILVGGLLALLGIFFTGKE